MLSGTNKALVRITNEETLLNEVCRVVVELGGYCMAWVGRVEYDESKTLRPVAHAGVCAEYLKSAKVSWADNELGRGPGGTSIRTGQPCFVRNIPFDPSFAPWREVAIQYGFNSIIALPLICDGQPYGALGIYSCEIDAFDEKEVEILTELANDLAFGISDIHARLERAKAEHEILHSEKRFKELTDLLPQTIYEADLNGTITFANKTALTTFGYSYNDVAEGIQMVNLVSEKEKNDAIENMQRIVKGLPVHKTEFEMVRKDGTTFPALTFTGPIIHDNETIGLRGSIVDISERKRSEEELSRKTVEIENQNKEYIALNEKLKIALEKAEESDRLKTAFLQNMSHEIRTPMNSILGFAELLSFQNVSSADQVKYLKVIEQSGRRMLNIINDIIDISKIETGQTTLYVQEIHVNQMIKDIYVHFSLEAQAKNLKMSYHCGLSDEECTINTDHTKLFQILTNLIKNAIKFTLNGCVNFGYNKKGEFIEFFVHDTGIGIDLHQKPIIFERFRQGTASLSRSYEGAGLGLSISKSYVEQLGGKIWVESEVGMGSTFYFTTPCI
jgi:PAS domain S-box-containing protein